MAARPTMPYAAETMNTSLPRSCDARWGESRPFSKAPRNSAKTRSTLAGSAWNRTHGGISCRADKLVTTPKTTLTGEAGLVELGGPGRLAGRPNRTRSEHQYELLERSGARIARRREVWYDEIVEEVLHWRGE